MLLLMMEVKPKLRKKTKMGIKLKKLEIKPKQLRRVVVMIGIMNIYIMNMNQRKEIKQIMEQQIMDQRSLV